MIPNVNIRVSDESCTPTQGTPYSAGYDLRVWSPENQQIKILADNDDHAPLYTEIHTGVFLDIQNPLLAAFIFMRSSTASRGLYLMNAVGVIDPDYQGELILRMRSVESGFVYHLERVAQLVFLPIAAVQLTKITTEFQPTVRGQGGYGSTGVH
jgi:dUTP pyrophosphatase